MTLEELAAELRRFAADRDWERFHTAKNLAIAVGVELGELLEHLQWTTEEQIRDFARSPEGKAAIGDELADVLIYLVRLADVLEIDLGAATSAKISANAERYPADEVRGSAAKRHRQPAPAVDRRE